MRTVSVVCGEQMKESDWKIFTAVKAEALQDFCHAILQESQTIIADSGLSPHERYLALYELIDERDSEIASLFNDHRRSIALVQLANLRSHGLVKDEQVSSMSEEMQKRTDPKRF